MPARNAETNLRCLFSIKTKNLNARHAAQKSRSRKCLPLDFPRDISLNHHQRAPVLPAQAAVHPIVQAARKNIMQVAFC
jgi:hypothetical protein